MENICGGDLIEGLVSGFKLLRQPMKIVIWPELDFLRGGSCYRGRHRQGGCSCVAGYSECKLSWDGAMLVQGFSLRL